MNWIGIGSDNGLSPIRRQAIIWTNAGLLSIAPFSEILIKTQDTPENASQNIVCEMADILSRGDELITGASNRNKICAGEWVTPWGSLLTEVTIRATWVETSAGMERFDFTLKVPQDSYSFAIFFHKISMTPCVKNVIGYSK